MKETAWWRRLARARLRLDTLLQGCATTLMARAAHDEPGTRQEADRLSATLEHSAQVAQDVLHRCAK